VYTLVEAPDGSGRVFAGTQTAAYMRGPDDEAWVDITGPDAPITTYWDAEALVSENTIRFATYGRGIFDYQLDPDHTGCYPVTDRDGDGVACDVDCDDTDATVFPGAPDACDGRDQDCDQATPDESDGDADGAPACDDCNDADPTRHPGATETCGDGVDQDCDGADASCGDDNGATNGGDNGSTDDGDNGDGDTPSDKAYAGGCACATGPAPAPGDGSPPLPAWVGLVSLALVSLVARRRS
jgi:hypothetical protein